MVVNYTTDDLIEMERQYVAPTYKRPPFVLEHGDGVCLFDTQGKRYLDFVAGIAVNAFGSADREIAEVIGEQAQVLGHVSNLYYSVPMLELARDLVASSFADKVFYCNSGAEANEAAFKFARRWALDRHGEGKSRIVAFTNAFHGRTMGALAATPREKYQAPFRPLMPNVQFATYNDLESAAAAIGDDVAAVIVEPVQGEGGIYVASQEFLAGLREICDRHNALLIYDEVQCGLGRTGKLWAYEHFGVTPDMMTLAKPLGGGLPMGAVLATNKVADALHPGDHGTTFGANPIICRAAQIVLKRINNPAFLQHVAEVGAYLQKGVESLDTPHIKEVRGMGLMVGVEMDIPAAPLIDEGYKHGLIFTSAGENVLRFVPPLILETWHVDELLTGLKEIFDGVDAQGV